MSLKKIAVIGDKDSVLPFKMLGFDVYYIEDASEVRLKITQLAENEYGVIYLTEQLAQAIPEMIGKYDQHLSPAIILIPNQSGTLGIGTQRLKNSVEKAIGQNIL